MREKNMEIPEKYTKSIEQRLYEQAAAEQSGDFHKLYEFTLPSIREKRTEERNDEPELSINSLKDFVKSIKTAQIKEVTIEKYHPTSEIYGELPSAVVKSTTLYNNSKASSFRTIWVLYNEVWYTTAVGKFHKNESA